MINYKRAHQIYENLKNLYGPSNCHLLQINSKSATATAPANPATVEFDPWLQYSKFNEMYNNTLISNQQVSAETEEAVSSPLLVRFDDEPSSLISLSHPLEEPASPEPMNSLLNGNRTQKRHGKTSSIIYS